jgi:hypothetical protein
MLYKNRLIAVFFLLAVTVDGLTAVRAADSVYPQITTKCDAEANVLTITHSLLKSDNGEAPDYTTADGTYSLWDMVTVAHETDSTRIIKSTKATRRCELSSGEYTVILEPKIFSEDLESRCGAMISGAVTITRNGHEILEHTAFEENCNDKTPIITRITVFGKTAEYKIKRIPKSKFY